MPTLRNLIIYPLTGCSLLFAGCSRQEVPISSNAGTYALGNVSNARERVEFYGKEITLARERGDEFAARLFEQKRKGFQKVIDSSRP